MKRRIGRRTLALLSVVLAAWVGAGGSPTNSGIARAAATYYVNGNGGSDSATCSQASPCLTIGHAITVAGSGDAISIAGAGGSFNGVYCEQITIDKSLTLQATSPSNPPTIDGGAGSGNPCGAVTADIPGDAVVRVGDATATSVTVTLQNLTIQHGDASNNPTDSSGYNGPGKGGGIFVYPHAALVGQSITLSGNVACTTCSNYPTVGFGYGGGIYNNFGAVTLTNSTVSSNEACSGSFCVGFGGGMYSHGGTTTVLNSTVSGNTTCSGSCISEGLGAGIYSNGTTTLTNSTVSGNSACSSTSCSTGLGGGMFIDSSNTTLTRSVVSDNAACSTTACRQGEGGGIYSQGGTTMLTDSTISHNTACSGGSCDNGASGGGVNGDSSSKVTLANTTVAGNIGCSTSCTNFSGVSGLGGGINNQGGTMTFASATVTGNIACSGSSCVRGDGGGIYSYGGTTTVTNSTVSQNTGCSQCSSSSTSFEGNGGGIDNQSGTVTVINSTVSQNTACTGSCTSGEGGGIGAFGTTTMINSTVSGNTAGDGGGIFAYFATPMLSNSIVAGNSGGSTSADCWGTVADGKPDGATTVGDNIIGSATSCSGLTNGVNGDQVGIDPKLDPIGLQTNGGPTQTIALLPGSPAIGKGDGATCGLTTIHDASGGTDPGPAGKDQRGEPRPSSTCDIGAYDSLGNPAVYVSPSGSDTNTCAVVSAPCRHVRVGLATVSQSGTVTIASGTYCEQLVVDQPVTLQGASGGTGAVIDGGAGTGNSCGSIDPPGHSVLTVGDDNGTLMKVTVQNLTIQHGDASNATGYGGGIYSHQGVTLTVRNSTVSTNTACSSCPQQGGIGGGIDTEGALTVINSTITGNSACSSSACVGYGGGITSVLTGTAVLVNSTVSGNMACSTTCHNGEGGGVNSSGVSFTLSNTIVAGNSGASDSPDCSGSLTDGPPTGTATVGDNILGDSTGCTFTPGSGDLVGTSSSKIDPRLGTLQNNGGPTQTMAPGPTSPAIGAGDPATCQSSSGGSAINNLDQRGVSRRVDVRLSCDIGADDTGGAIALTKGWNLIGLPLQSSGTDSAAGLISNVNSQLGSGTVTTLATYSHGAFHLYVAGYTADQPLMASQGIFILSNSAGQWLVPGTAYTSGQPVNLQAGWNLVSAPYPYHGLNGDDIKGEIGQIGSTGCGLKEVAVFSGGSYQIYTPSNGPAGAAFHVSNLLGMFLQCANVFSWTPS